MEYIDKLLFVCCCCRFVVVFFCFVFCFVVVLPKASVLICVKMVNLQLSFFLVFNSKIIIWKAQGVPQ